MSSSQLLTADSHSPDAPSLSVFVRLPLGVTGRIGDTIRQYVGRVTLLASSVLIIAWFTLRPSTWRRTIRDEVVRQGYFTGVQAMKFVAVVAVFVGIGLVAQILYWTSMAGQSEYVGLFMAVVLIRQLAPLLAALIVIGRSGTAMVAEIGTMRVTGSVALIESAGIDPVLYLVVPRAIATAASVAGLTVWLVVVALVTGYLMAAGMDLTNLTVGQFIDQVLGALDMGAYMAVAVTTLLGGWVVAIICTGHGLQCSGSVANVPQVLPRCFIECLLAVFIISGVVTVLL